MRQRLRSAADGYGGTLKYSELSSKTSATLDGIAALWRLRMRWLTNLAAAAECSSAGRFIVRADQELLAYLELESAIKTRRHNHECDCPEPMKNWGSRR